LKLCLNTLRVSNGSNDVHVAMNPTPNIYPVEKFANDQWGDKAGAQRFIGDAIDAGYLDGVEIADKEIVGPRRASVFHVQIGLDVGVGAEDDLSKYDVVIAPVLYMVKRGMVRYVGCSNWQAWKIMQGQGIADKRGATRRGSVNAGSAGFWIAATGWAAAGWAADRCGSHPGRGRGCSREAHL